MICAVVCMYLLPSLLLICFVRRVPLSELTSSSAVAPEGGQCHLKIAGSAAVDGQVQIRLPLRHQVSDPCICASRLKSLPFAAVQAIGATTPAWTAVLAWCLLGTRETVMTYSALLPLMIGVVINTGFEPSFNLIGFTACAIATWARALKSVMQVSKERGGVQCLPAARLLPP